jgi:hypothetical protein
MNYLLQRNGLTGLYRTAWLLAILLFLFAGLPLQAQFIEVDKIQASDKAKDDYFGISVSISGDRAIVGAFGQDTGGSNAGAAYLFEPSNQPPDCSGAAIADQSADANCQATISGADVTGVTDPDGDPLTITVSPTTLVLEANTVTVTADDGNGGMCSVNITVNVVDDTPPTITAISRSYHPMAAEPQIHYIYS